MVQILARIAALMGLAALASAQQASIDCGRQNDLTGPSDNTVYLSGGYSFAIRCHTLQLNNHNDWTFVGRLGVEACVAACATSSTCLNSVSTYDGLYCYHSATKTLSNGVIEKRHPYISTFKIKAPLNCKDKSSSGTIFTPEGSSQKYQILCDYQFGGNTLGASKRAETFEQCVGFCDTTAGCVDVVYSDAKYCWLKSSKTNGYASGGWWTAVKVVDGTGSGSTNTGSTTGVGAVNCFDNSADNTVFTTPLGTYDIRCNFQYDGDVLGASKRAETFEQCVDFCDSDAGCVDVVWSNAKYCWLKSSKKGNGYISGGWFTAVKRTVAAN
ncbi:uncharacterized protein B0I36DRAFT_367132 [Microdochium trichocladiopsis]|uniref:Apple domain-containing protein n=1 Tax=Microdochium trichocladiopsis TaxID=1682393 RepID=A0A9P8XZ94_9PEZI|nr:uncharacterized protein B0I36DRAFT_367132 [Microdochium trichocladiopsis]KAH7025265.1 hypothetical protein B0I36DRAFT_367132 [Microdochium trichocladiopsis]